MNVCFSATTARQDTSAFTRWEQLFSGATASSDIVLPAGASVVLHGCSQPGSAVTVRSITVPAGTRVCNAPAPCPLPPTSALHCTSPVLHHTLKSFLHSLNEPLPSSAAPPLTSHHTPSITSISSWWVTQPWHCDSSAWWCQGPLSWEVQRVQSVRQSLSPYLAVMPVMELRWQGEQHMMYMAQSRWVDQRSIGLLANEV